MSTGDPSSTSLTFNPVASGAGPTAVAPDAPGGFSRLNEGISDFANAAWDKGKQGAEMVADVTTSQAGNEWMMWLGAIGAAAVAYAFVPKMLARLLPGDSLIGQRGARGLLSLAAIGLAAYVAAGVIGELRDDPKPQVRAEMSTPATKDPRVQFQSAASGATEEVVTAPPAAAPPAPQNPPAPSAAPGTGAG